MAAMTNSPQAIISVFVINENEYHAVRSLLKASGWYEIGSGPPCEFTPYVPLHYSSYSFEKAMGAERGEGIRTVRADVVKTSYSGNMLMSATVMSYYHVAEVHATGMSSGEAPARYSILYGCAGRISAAGDGSPLPGGETAERVFLVSEATWAEQGKCATQQIAGHHVDLTEIKVKRLDPFTAVCPPGFLGDAKKCLADTIGSGAVGVAKAVCFDKVIEVDLQEGDEISTRRKRNGLLLTTYRELLAGGGYSLVDMESFGFLFGHPTAIDNVLIMRVPTDELSNHSGSNDDHQREALVECAREFLLPVLRFIEDKLGSPVVGASPARAIAMGEDELVRHLRRVLSTATGAVGDAMAAKGRLSKSEALEILGRANNLFPTPVSSIAKQVRKCPIDEAADELLRKLGVEVADETTEKAAMLICDLFTCEVEGFSTERMHDYTGFVGEKSATLGWIYLIEALSPTRRADTFRAALRRSLSDALEAEGLSLGDGWEVSVERHDAESQSAGTACLARASITQNGIERDRFAVSSGMYADSESRLRVAETLTWRGYEDNWRLRERVGSLATGLQRSQDGSGA